ncbi:MAG: Slp family lipoprotein [Wenzhouxiangellaceae bacterium]|nr:Slp family lipoprotein [Wenzhouxiangellaceae bacterium]
MSGIAFRIATVLAALAVAAGCASSPFDGRDASGLSPAEALENPDRVGAPVLWGGRVVGIVNAGDHTDLEVIALPLAYGDRPRRNADGGARFVIRQPGFLEPMTYAPGRFVTAYGIFSGIEKRAVGDFPVDHPVLESEQLELWPVDPNTDRASVHTGFQFRF